MRAQRHRRSTSKKKAQEDEAYAQDARKTQKYATLGLRQRQVLEEVNDFVPLDGPESEEEDDIINGNDESLATDSFTFTPVPLHGMTNQSRAHTYTMPSTRKSVGHTEQENQVSYVPPRLTPRTNHIPPSVPSAYLNTPVVPRAQPPPVIDPQLLAGDSEEQIGLHMESSRNETSSKYVQQTRFEQRFATAGPCGLVTHNTPTPFRGVRRSLMAEVSSSSIESTEAQQPFESLALGGVKRSAPPLTEVDGLQVVQKVKIGDGGSRGCVRCADFDRLYSSIIHLAVGHYQAILANSTIYPGDVESRNWSGEAWAASC
ncbi:hypothetical protein BDR06DRAFT_1015306 [Suillus hirtellus]|nr:hypothetical protein BDR06DRAFT_1015306 [Suillus hirtellus]